MRIAVVVRALRTRSQSPRTPRNPEFPVRATESAIRPPPTAGESTQSWAGTMTIGVIPIPWRKIFVPDVARVFDGAVERQLTYKEEATLQQGMLTGDVAKQHFEIADRLVMRFLNEVKRELLLP